MLLLMLMFWAKTSCNKGKIAGMLVPEMTVQRVLVEAVVGSRSGTAVVVEAADGAVVVVVDDDMHVAAEAELMEVDGKPGLGLIRVVQSLEKVVAKEVSLGILAILVEQQDRGCYMHSPVLGMRIPVAVTGSIPDAEGVHYEVGRAIHTDLPARSKPLPPYKHLSHHLVGCSFAAEAAVEVAVDCDIEVAVAGTEAVEDLE